jgi:hypothetical protein
MHNPSSDPTQPADILVVGGSSAGVTLAVRLSEDPSRRALLREAGPAFSPDEVPAELSDPEDVASPTFDWGYDRRGGASTAEMPVRDIWLLRLHPNCCHHRRCQHGLRVLATWNPRLAGVYLCRAVRIRGRHRTLGSLFKTQSQCQLEVAPA